MVYRWRCRHCSFVAWGESRSGATDAVQSHLLQHHQSQITRYEMQIRWECPYCATTGEASDKREGVQSFKRHLLDHVERNVESGTHVGEAVDGRGSVLVLGPTPSDGVEEVRRHFHEPGEVAVVVTGEPADRVEMLVEDLDTWPVQTILVTTESNPLADVDVPTGIPIDVVVLDGALGLHNLGESIVTAIAERGGGGKLSVEFDILQEIVGMFDTETVFKFLHVLTKRFESGGALSHFYLDAETVDETTLNLLKEAFDITIDASGDAITTA